MRGGGVHGNSITYDVYQQFDTIVSANKFNKIGMCL